MLSTCPEDRALLESNPSAEVGTKTVEGGFCCPLFLEGGFCCPLFFLNEIGIKAINSSGIGSHEILILPTSNSEKPKISFGTFLYQFLVDEHLRVYG
jgi:hypothetical protein